MFYAPHFGRVTTQTVLEKRKNPADEKEKRVCDLRPQRQSSCTPPSSSSWSIYSPLPTTHFMVVPRRSFTPSVFKKLNILFVFFFFFLDEKQHHSVDLSPSSISRLRRFFRCREDYIRALWQAIWKSVKAIFKGPYFIDGETVFTSRRQGQHFIGSFIFSENDVTMRNRSAILSLPFSFPANEKFFSSKVLQKTVGNGSSS